MGFITTTTDSTRGPQLRSVFLTFPNVAPPGVGWTAEHTGRKFEMTSFRGGPVELYLFNEDGLPVYQGNVRDYARGEDLLQAFRAAWYATQPSTAARTSFEVSAKVRS